MDVMTLAQIKAQLGLADTTYDTALTAVLPALNAKVKQIVGRPMSTRVSLATTVDATTAYVSPIAYDNAIRPRYRGDNVGNPISLELLNEFVAPGQQIECDNLSAGTIVDDVYDREYLRETGRLSEYLQIDLSANATATGTAVATLGMNVAYHNVVAKLAWWMIDTQDTTAPSATVASKSVGDISVSYSTTGANIDGKYGVPSWAVRGLPRYGRYA